MEYLVRIGERWHYRRRVPSDIQQHFPTNQIKRALGTTRRCDAKAIAAALHADVERLFLCLRMKVLTDDQIRQMVASFLSSSLKKSEARRAEKPGAENKEWAQFRVPQDDLSGKTLTGVQRKSQVLTCCVQVLRDMLASGFALEYSPLHDRAAEQLQAAGLKADKGSPEYRKLLREIVKGWVDALQIEAERCTGNYDSDVERRLLAKYEDATQSPTPAPPIDLDRLAADIVARVAAEVTPKRCTVTLGEAINKCLTHLAANGNGGRGLAPSSLEKYWDQFPLLIGLLGGPERPLVDIAPIELFELRQKLLRFPSRWKTGRYRHLSLGGVLEADIPPEHCLSKRTVNTYMARLGTLFTFAALPAVRWLPENIARGLTLALTDEELADAKQRPYTRDELAKLFELVPVSKRKPHEAWLPLLAVYTGCSMTELAQLRVSDIKEVDGLQCIDIMTIEGSTREKGDTRRVKNFNRRRLVPMHSHVIEVGFLWWVENVRVTGQRDLFPAVAKEGDARKNYGAQTFRRLRERVIKNPKGTSFHTFRHTIADHLKLEHGVRDDYYHALIGHAPSHPTDQVYTSPHHVRQLFTEAVSKIDYGLDVQALKRRYSRLL